MQFALLALRNKRERRKTQFLRLILCLINMHTHTLARVRWLYWKERWENWNWDNFLSTRERCWTTTRKRISQEEEDENSAKWKYWKMHFAQKWWTRKNGKGKLVCIEEVEREIDKARKEERKLRKLLDKKLLCKQRCAQEIESFPSSISQEELKWMAEHGSEWMMNVLHWSLVIKRRWSLCLFSWHFVQAFNIKKIEYFFVILSSLRLIVSIWNLHSNFV